MTIDFKKKCVILIIFMMFVRVCPENKKYVDSHTLPRYIEKNDLPSRKDFRLYFDSINRLLRYVSRNPNCVDFGMKFGLFLLNVNLRPFTKKMTIPTPLRNDLKRLIDISDQLQGYYKKQLTYIKHVEPHYYPIIKIFMLLLENEDKWSKLLLPMNLDLSMKTRLSYNYAFPEWDKFELTVDDLLKWMPNPNSSVMCLSLLSKNMKKQLDKPEKPCSIQRECVEMLDFGINFGYALTFKLIFLLLARLSQGCIIFSTVQDEYIRTQLCVGAYKEAEFIVKHGYRKADLLLEQIALCSLEGHAQFLRRSWLSNCLRFQTPYGYFGNTIYNPPENEQEKRQLELEFIEASDKLCLQHVNPVAVGALSAALRYILEQYY